MAKIAKKWLKLIYRSPTLPKLSFLSSGIDTGACHGHKVGKVEKSRFSPILPIFAYIGTRHSREPKTAQKWPNSAIKCLKVISETPRHPQLAFLALGSDTGACHGHKLGNIEKSRFSPILPIFAYIGTRHPREPKTAKNGKIRP